MSYSTKSVALGALSVIAASIIGIWFAYDSTEPLEAIHSLTTPAVSAKKPRADHFDLVCEGKIATPVNGFDSPFKIVNQTFIAGIDIANHTGWYQGNFAISEARKGTATTRGNMVTVSRPALFERYGSMITAEEFTLDRASGIFEQSVTLSDKRRIILINAYCGMLIKAPF